MQFSNSLGSQKSITLQNGRKMPLLGLGTCIGDLKDVEGAVKHAIKVGYRYMLHAISYMMTSTEAAHAALFKVAYGKNFRCHNASAAPF